MPYTERRTKSGGYRVTSPHGVKAKNTTKANADAQLRLLRAIEHNPHFKPRK
jgi:hypothetical protein